MSAPTAKQIELLQHTLGINENRREPYRNHFVASPEHHDMPDLEQLEAAGLMIRGHRPGFLPASDIVFYTTEAGRVLAITSLPEPKKQTRYEEYLHADGCAGDSFGEFLCGTRLPEYEDRGRWPYEYRMYRRAPGAYTSYDRDVQGDWAPTKKEAKASYKAALKKHQKLLRAERRAYA